MQISAKTFSFQGHKENNSQLFTKPVTEGENFLTLNILALYSCVCPAFNLMFPAPLFHLPHLHLQSLPCCQSTVPKFIRAVAAGYCMPGKIILDWLPSLLLLPWHADKMLIGLNVLDTKGETACSRHGASCHPFSRGTGSILSVLFCLLKRS